MKIDNEKTIVNFANSFLKHFSAPTWHESVPEVDKVLQGHPKVVALLFDGLGRYIIEKHLRKKGFIRSHFLTTVQSTFPPTTVAATTGFLTGKFPVETGWLSWNQYFEEYGCDIEVFLNTRTSDGKLMRDKNKSILFEKCPYVTLFKQMKKAQPDMDVFDVRTKKVLPDGVSDFKEAYRVISKNLKKSKKSFTYFYWPAPDCLIHRYGVLNYFHVHREIKRIERFVKKLVKHHPDTLFFTFADHGLIDVSYLDICDHPDLYALLSRPPSFEVRTINFFVKSDKKAEFERLFEKYYGLFFELLNREQVFQRQLFGKGAPHKMSEKFIGDFIAIAQDRICLYSSKAIAPHKLHLHKGHHAGGTNEEMEINVSAFNV